MVTTYDIAEKAGVSQATVSLVLSKRDAAVRISEGTRQRVLQAADQLGYRHNGLARAVATGKSRMLGFVVHQPEYEPVTRMLIGALEEAEAQNYTLKVLHLRDNETAHPVVERCLEMRLAGVIAVLLRQEMLEDAHHELMQRGVPLAMLDSSFPQTWGVRVISDDLQGCRLAIEHLVGLGHRRIAFMAGNPEDGIAVLREQGYREAMRKFGLKVPHGFIAPGLWMRQENGATRQLLELAPRPTAIFCASDEMAMVVCHTLRRSGLRVPQDVSVVGFSDLAAAKLFDPHLTTVAPPFHAMGRMVVHRLLTRIQSHETQASFEDSASEEHLPTRLMARESSGPLLAPPASSDRIRPNP